MKKMLRRDKPGIIYHVVNGKKIAGSHKKLIACSSGCGISGNTSGITGNVSKIYGDAFMLKGNVSGLAGNVTGVSGDATGIIGNLDKCSIAPRKRKAGVDIQDLVGERGLKR